MPEIEIPAIADVRSPGGDSTFTPVIMSGK
jgi:hypothetical protein